MSATALPEEAARDAGQQVTHWRFPAPWLTVPVMVALWVVDIRLPVVAALTVFGALKAHELLRLREVRSRRRAEITAFCARLGLTVLDVVPGTAACEVRYTDGQGEHTARWPVDFVDRE